MVRPRDPAAFNGIALVYADTDAFLKTWDAAVADLAELGLVLPDAVRIVQERGRALAAATDGLE